MRKNFGKLVADVRAMRIVRHPDLADDIKEAAEHYADISEQVLNVFWDELDFVFNSIKKNPRRHHFSGCGLRRANFKRYPYHILYDVEDNHILLLVLRHDRRHPDYGLDRTNRA